MKKIILINIFLLLQVAYSQTNNYKITYKQFERNIKKDAILYVKENEASVMHLINTSAEFINKVKKDTTYIDENGRNVTMFSNTTINKALPDKYYIVNPKNHEIKIVDYIMKEAVLVSDKIDYNWKITNETKKIKDYTCYKATSNFRGNTYEVWFTPDIPINAGPWKWHGLPGLIVEASDKHKSETYLIEKVEKLTENTPTIPQGLRKINLKTFIKENDESLEDLFNSINTDRNAVRIIESQKRVGLELIYEWEEQDKKN